MKNNSFSLFKNLNERVYLVSLVGLLVPLFLRSTTIVPNDSTLHQLLFIAQIFSMLVLLKIYILDRHSFKQLLGITVILFFFLLSGYKAEYYDLFYYAIFVFGAYKVQLSKIVKVWLLISAILTTVALFLAVIGMIPDRVQAGQFNVRHACGFLTPTDFGARIFYLLLAYCLWRKMRLTNVESWVICGLSAVLFYLTEARLDCFLLISLALVGFYNSHKKRIGTAGLRSVNIFSDLFVCLSVAAAWLFNFQNSILINADEFLSGRLHYGWIALHKYGPTWLGQFIPQNGNGDIAVKQHEYFYIDSSYIQLLTIFGVVVTAFILAGILYLQWKLLSYQAQAFLLYLAFVLISSAFDQHLIDPSYNFVLLVLFAKSNLTQNSAGKEHEKVQKNLFD